MYDVTTHRVPNDDWIYWNLSDTTHVYTLQITVKHTLVSLVSLHQSSGNGSQWHKFPILCIPELFLCLNCMNSQLTHSKINSSTQQLLLQLPRQLLVIQPLHGPHRKYHFQQFLHCWVTLTCRKQLPSVAICRTLPINDCYLLEDIQ
jgi:hypothetical protein